MNTWNVIFLVTTIGIFSFTVAAQSNSVEDKQFERLQEQYKSQFELQRRINFELAEIKTKEALIEKSKNNPTLNQLSQSALDRFVESSKFNKSGLVSFNYLTLESELTPTQIYKLLSLFGKQHVTYLMSNARVESAVDALILNSAPYDIVKSISDPGVAPDIPNDYKDYRCVSRATCEYSLRHICMSGC